VDVKDIAIGQFLFGFWSGLDIQHLARNFKWNLFTSLALIILSILLIFLPLNLFLIYKQNFRSRYYPDKKDESGIET
jgi:type IV secretory pathway TrbL component